MSKIKKIPLLTSDDGLAAICNALKPSTYANPLKNLALRKAGVV